MIIEITRYFGRFFTNKIFVAVTVLTAAIAVPVSQQLHQNIHVVIPNQVYRSAQLSSTALHAMINTEHIKTIVNLRGQNTRDSWYQDEIRTAQQMGLHHYDVRLSSKVFPTQAQLQQLTDIIEKAPKPLLIHCKCGADRTGLGSAMTLTLLTHQPMSSIENQYSWKYLALSDRSVGKQVFAAYKNWLTTHNKTTNKDNFKKWVATQT